MSNVIQFLETLGSNPAQARFSTTQYAAAVAALDLGDTQRRALADRDHAALNNLLAGRERMVFAVMLPDDAGDDEQFSGLIADREVGSSLLV